MCNSEIVLLDNVRAGQSVCGTVCLVQKVVIIWMCCPTWRSYCTVHTAHSSLRLPTTEHTTHSKAHGEVHCTCSEELLPMGALFNLAHFFGGLIFFSQEKGRGRKMRKRREEEERREGHLTIFLNFLLALKLFTWGRLKLREGEEERRRGKEKKKRKEEGGKGKRKRGGAEQVFGDGLPHQALGARL